METLVVYYDAACTVGESIPVADSFVARCVSAIAAENVPDAIEAARILNAAAQQQHAQGGSRVACA